MNYLLNSVLGIFLCVFAVVAYPASDSVSNSPPGYAIASANPMATRAGLEILAQGGNAFDAAVAVATTLAVVEPYHSGLGGGGFWLLHDEKNNKNVFVDSREVAPLAATKDMFLAQDKTVIPNLSLNGGLAAAIPGEPAALVYIAQKYGHLPLSKSLAPAIKLAREGFAVDNHLRHFVFKNDRAEQLRKFPASAAIFLKNGAPYPAGDLLIQKDLANTLEAIAQYGHDGFYKGEVAKKLVKGINDAGGIWTLEDLAKYKIKIREPLVGAYHNMLIVTAPPPSGGGITLLTMLNILSHKPLSTMSTLEWMHYVIESMRLAYWQLTQYLGDPDFIKIPVDNLISATNAKYLTSLIPKDKAIDSKVLQGTAVSLQHNNTTHFSILDKEGNRVSATLSINYIWGSSVVAEGTGVLLNDVMDDFSVQTGQPNVYGLVGSDKNAIAPGKRPLSSMTPTFLELPGRVAIIGSPGGSRIPTMVLLASLPFNDSFGAITMTSAMRFHHQYLPDVVQFEPNSLSPSLQESLKAMGYHLMPLTEYYGDMQTITWDKRSHFITATSDPRHIGLAVVVNKNSPGSVARF